MTQTPRGAGGHDDRPASPPRLVTLAQRADFLRAASARRQGAGSFLLQARERRTEETAAGPASIRVGFTCSKKVGNSVTRNRARRRLREAARAVLPRAGRHGWDYVLVGRPEATIARPFADLLRDLESAIAAIHSTRPPRRPRGQPEPPHGGAGAP